MHSPFNTTVSAAACVEEVGKTNLLCCLMCDWMPLRAGECGMTFDHSKHIGKFLMKVIRVEKYHRRHFRQAARPQLLKHITGLEHS